MNDVSYGVIPAGFEAIYKLQCLQAFGFVNDVNFHGMSRLLAPLFDRHLAAHNVKQRRYLISRHI